MVQQDQDYENLLLYLKEIIFSLDLDNVNDVVTKIMRIFDDEHPYSFCYYITHLIYRSYFIQMKNIYTYFQFLKVFNKQEKIIQTNINILKILIKYLSKSDEIEAKFFFMMMIKENIIDEAFLAGENNKTQQDFLKELLKSEGEMSDDDLDHILELYCEGHNPIEIAKIIRNDEIDELQEITSQTNFDFDQTIEPSLYERCSFVNHENVSLVDYAAFFGSVKCFRYLLVNGSNIDNTGKYAVAGGNLEIIHLCEQYHSSFEDAYKTAIQFHRNDIFKYMKQNSQSPLTTEMLNELGEECIKYENYEIFFVLVEENMLINNDMVNIAAENGDLYLIQYFIRRCAIGENTLIFAMFSDNMEVVKEILQKNTISIDVNVRSLYLFYLIFILII